MNKVLVRILGRVRPDRRLSPAEPKRGVVRSIKVLILWAGKRLEVAGIDSINLTYLIDMVNPCFPLALVFGL
jgi:hypothetical protein